MCVISIIGGIGIYMTLIILIAPISFYPTWE